MQYSWSMKYIANNCQDTVHIARCCRSSLHCIPHTESDHSVNKLCIPANIPHTPLHQSATHILTDTPNTHSPNCTHHRRHHILHTVRCSHGIPSNIRCTRLHRRSDNPMHILHNFPNPPPSSSHQNSSHRQKLLNHRFCSCLNRADISHRRDHRRKYRRCSCRPRNNCCNLPNTLQFGYLRRAIPELSL